ncbi:MAG TPA: deoxyribonuclease V [Chloroflexi bacterium]|jgi:deoxyribonuclease V|nr:deoxyribonuclease V [Chloroflexota bacterium]
MLKPVIHHSWDLSVAEAIKLQRRLAEQVITEDARTQYDTVAGIDVGIRGEVMRAAVVVVQLPDLNEVTRVVAEAPLTFPYVPGLLSFREVPVILQALERLVMTPDVLMFDGQGIAHPRRLGIAAHVGVLLDHPAVGCAKSRLYGRHQEPAEERGSAEPLMAGDEVIGMVVRTRTRVRPVYVSPGHKVSMQGAVDLVLACGRKYRLPEPTRLAHRVASVE